MELNSKSVIAGDHFQKACYYIIQERQIAIKRHARESKALKAQELTRRKQKSTVGSLTRPVTIVIH